MAETIDPYNMTLRDLSNSLRIGHEQSDSMLERASLELDPAADAEKWRQQMNSQGICHAIVGVAAQLEGVVAGQERIATALENITELLLLKNA